MKTNSRNLKKSYNLLLLLSVLLLLFWKSTKRVQASKPTNYAEFYEVLAQKGFSSDIAKVITSVAAWETANFKSPLYVTSNNCFGMHKPKTWKSRCVAATDSGYCVYNNFFDSVCDYVYWCDRFILGVHQDPIRQVEAMKQNDYFTAPLKEYKKGVLFYYNKL